MGVSAKVERNFYSQANKASKRMKVVTDHMRTKRGYLVLRLGEESAEDFRQVKISCRSSDDTNAGKIF